MAEIRKHDPAAGNAIAQALRAAMGDPVRPNQPGSTPAGISATQPTHTTTTSWVSLQVSKPTEPDEADEADEADED